MYVSEKGVLKNSYTFFHTPSSMAKSMFFYLKCTGHFFCSRDYEVKRNNYNSYLIMYVRKGHGKVIYDNKTYMVKENDVVILNCYNEHMYASDEWETLWLHFDGNVIKDYFDVLFERSGCVFSLGNSTIIPEYLSEIINSFKNKKTLNEPLVSCYIQRMLTELLLLSSSSDYNNLKNPINLAIDYINDHYGEKITLEDLSSFVNMSPFYFSRKFKKETGYSPYEYIIMTRLNEAKKLLKITNLLIKEISFKVGFNSEANFVTCFRSHTNLTPKEFRDTPF